MFLTFSKIRQQADQIIELEDYNDADDADFMHDDSEDDESSPMLSDTPQSPQSLEINTEAQGARMAWTNQSSMGKSSNQLIDECDVVDAAYFSTQPRSLPPSPQLSPSPASYCGGDFAQLSAAERLQERRLGTDGTNAGDADAHGEGQSSVSQSGTGSATNVRPAEDVEIGSNGNAEEFLPRVRAVSRAASRRVSVARSRRVSINGRSRRGSVSMRSVEMWRRDIEVRFSWVPGWLWSFWYRQDPMFEPGVCGSVFASLPHCLSCFTITCTCCYDEIKGTQDLKIYSHAHSLIHFLVF